MQLLKVTDSIYVVPAKGDGRFPFAQSIYVDAERKILFDAGIGPDLMVKFLKEYQVDIAVMSHGHPDHVAGAWHVARHAPVFVSKESQESFGNLDAMAARFIAGEQETTLWRGLVEHIMGFKEVPPDQVYDRQSAFDLGSVKLVAMHTPGHTKDHYCFFEVGSSCMFLFDIDLSPYGPWYGHPESDVDQFEASVNYARSYEPEIAISSHMGVLRKGVDKALKNYAAHFTRRDERIYDLLDHPRTARELAEKFPFTPKFFPKLRPIYLYWETQMVKKHLDRLVEQRKATPRGDTFQRA